jgi:acetyl-CoA acetyltransferase
MKPGRYPDLDSHGIFHFVLNGALSKWPIRPRDIDGLLTAPGGQASGATDANIHERLIAELGIQPQFAETISSGGATFALMVQRASMAIASGQANSVLCVGAGKFLKPGAGGAELMARAISEQDFEFPYGTFIPALYALIANRFMAERGVTREDLARVAVSARKWALLNPDARMHEQGPITIDDVINSRPIAEPFHYLDCSVPSDGGGAFLVTRADIGKHLTDRPAYVKGYGESHLSGSISSARNLTATGAVISGRQAFQRARLTPSDIDVVELYDAFTATPLILLENLGFCQPGESGHFVQSGATDPGGKLPMNTNGGLLSFGHTGDASGMSVLIEGARQVMGHAGANQVERADHVLVHCYGGMMYDHATLILGSEP